MTARLRLVRTGPLTSLQDEGRPGYLSAGISASGPMDATSFRRAGGWLGAAAPVGLEFTRNGLVAELIEGTLAVAGDGGAFELRINGRKRPWPFRAQLTPGDRLEILPGPRGNYGYLRFGAAAEVAPVLGSVSTNTIAGIGGLNGRCLEAGDEIAFLAAARRAAPPVHPAAEAALPEGPIRIIWGLHADHFAPDIRSRFLAARFVISAKLDRMGVRLEDTEGLFRHLPPATLVSDAVVPGDVQILGDGTPIVLMRDHQPTGGYPRIATLIGADFDRFAQIRPGAGVSFASVTLAQAQTLRKARP